MINSKRNKFIIAIAIQVCIIFFIIFFKLLILTGGEEVLLKIRPIDPRDPFRGDYITFQYDISRIKGNSFHSLGSQEKIKYGDKIYIPLVKKGNYWIKDGSVSKNKPNAGIFIKGAIKDIKWGENLPEEIFVSYGIEEYFIPENSGRDVSFSGRDTFAKVVLDKNGNAVLKSVYVNGKLWPPKDSSNKMIPEFLSDDADFGAVILEEENGDVEPEVDLSKKEDILSDKIIDPSGLYQFTKLDGWRIRSSVFAQKEVSIDSQVSQLILETENFSSHMINNGGSSRKKYDRGATLNIIVIKGEQKISHNNAKILESSKFALKSGEIGEHHYFSEPTFLGQLRDIHFNYKGNYYVIRFAYDKENFLDGEKIFKQILDSFEFIKG